MATVRIRDSEGRARILSCHGLDALALEDVLETCPQGFFELRAALFEEISGSGREDGIFVAHVAVAHIGWRKVSVRYLPREEVTSFGDDATVICRTLRISAVI